MITSRALSAILGLATFFALLGGTSAAFGAERVVLQLKWDHQFQFAGYYAAQWQGYYTDAGLDVEIRSGVRADRKIFDVVKELEAGRADFGIGGAELLIARDQGTPLVVCAAIFQQSATAYYALEELGIQSIADLLNHRVARTPDTLSDIELRAMLLAEGIDPALVPPYPLIVGLEQLLDGDVIAGYSTDMPYHARRLGLSLTSLRPSDYAVNFYGDSLFTTRALVKQDPAMVEKFVAASLKGWEYALAHPEEIIERIANDLPRTFKLEDPVEFFRFESEEVRALSLYPTVKVGHLNPRRWLQIHSVLQQSGQVQGDLDLEDFIFDPSRRTTRMAEKQLQKQRVVLLTFAGLAGIALAAAFLMRCRQQAHRKEKERLRTIFNSIYDAIFIHNLDGTVAFVNEVGIEMFGLVPERATQYTIADFSAPGSPVDQVPVLIEEAVSQGKRSPFEWKVKRPLDGEIIDVEVFLRLVSLEDRDAILATVRDVTERKRAEEGRRESEERFRATFEQAAVGIAHVAPDGHWIRVNQKLCDIVGFKREELLKGTFQDITHPDDLDADMEYVRQVLSGEIQNYSMEKRYIRKGGSLVWINLTVSLVREPWGDPKHFISVVEDITDRKQAEEDLTEANRELETFVYTVSHDLRTPLVPIIGYADFLRESCRDRLDEQALDCLAEISESGQRMVALMEDLLTLAKVGQVEWPAEPLDTGEVVNEVVGGLAGQITQAGVSVDVSDLPPLRLPKTFLAQIIDNLIGNAVRYAGRAGSPIEVGGERKGDLVRLYVRDHGPGIPVEERSRIFEVFYRGATGKKSPGTGVGLATVLKIARLYGGQVWVEETEGGGSTFWVEMMDAPTTVEKEENTL